MKRTARNERQAGFSMIETLVALGIASILLTVGVPAVRMITQSYRISGDARDISAALNLARMRAAAGFTHARVYEDLNGQTFHLEIWNKVGDATHANGCWQTDGDKAANACTQATSPVNPLAQGDGFGFGGITTPPNAQITTVAQAPPCTTGVAGPAAGGNIANTACIEFNSRGYPVDTTNAIVGSEAVYIANNAKLYCAVAVSIAGQASVYNYNGSAWTAN